MHISSVNIQPIRKTLTFNELIRIYFASCPLTNTIQNASRSIETT